MGAGGCGAGAGAGFGLGGGAGAGAGAGFGAATVTIAALPDALPLLAVMIAAPAPTAFTTPLADTVAADGVAEVHAIGAPWITRPLSSFTLAVNVVLLPTVSVAEAGVIMTVTATGACTTTTALADCPSLVAVMVAAPAATPVTSPLAFTVATLGDLLFHATVRPASGSWFSSNGVAVSCTLPGSTMVSRPGDTDTDATRGGSTVMVEMPDAPPALAAICTVPCARPVTTPASDTVPTDAFPVFQKTRWPEMVWPPGLVTVACRAVVLPTATVSTDGETFTDPTGPLGDVLELHDAIANANHAAAAIAAKRDRPGIRRVTGRAGWALAQRRLFTRPTFARHAPRGGASVR